MGNERPIQKLIDGTWMVDNQSIWQTEKQAREWIEESTPYKEK